MHSGRDFCWLYERQDQLAFLNSHVRAFAHFGGVPQRMVYNNLSVALLDATGLNEGGYSPLDDSRPSVSMRWQVLTSLPHGDSLDQISEVMRADVDQLASVRI